MSMLYLEDYLELIEHLPQETVDRLTDMRELDLQVQNSMDSIEKRTARFFQSAYHMSAENLDSEHNSILKEYKKILEDTEEKVQLANTMTETLSKYTRRLDQDILKFKLELEADNSGITEIIEKRLQEPEVTLPPSPAAPLAHRPSRRQSHQPYGDHSNKHNLSHEHKRQDAVNSVEQKFQRLSLPAASPSHSQVMFNVDQMGAGSSAIAAAASQAIAATQQMQQGRRTASLKASYDAINSGSIGFNRTNELSSAGRQLSGAAQTAIAAAQQTHKRHRRKRGQGHSNAATKATVIANHSAAAEILDESAAMEADPDDPRYCICNEVAYGDMVACDNENCPYEWYHYSCVGITEAPEGKWYCPQCTATMKRRNRKSLL